MLKVAKLLDYLTQSQSGVKRDTAAPPEFYSSLNLVVKANSSNSC